jgi:chemotaxis protein CheX
MLDGGMPLNAACYEKLGTTEEALIKQLHSDVQEIFTTMVGVEDVMHLPISVNPETHFINCVTPMVGFAGLFNGLVSLHIPQSLALSFTSRMIGMEVTDLNEDVNDALGEIANMIAGSFKHHLAKDGHEVRLSTPSVVTGNDYSIASGSLDDTITLLYDSNGDWFMISIVIEI